jgi:hypothetical protein
VEKRPNWLNMSDDEFKLALFKRCALRAARGRFRQG